LKEVNIKLLEFLKNLQETKDTIERTFTLLEEKKEEKFNDNDIY